MATSPLPSRMDHLPVAFRRRLGPARVQVGRGAGHGHVSAGLALLQHTGGGAKPQTWRPVRRPVGNLRKSAGFDVGNQKIRDNLLTF